MRLVYFDEAGIGSEPITTVVAVIVHGDDQMPKINADVRAIRVSLPTTKRQRFEFKADVAFSHFRKFGADSLYVRMMRDFLTMMKTNEVVLVACAVELAGFKAHSSGTISALDYAFATCAMFAAAWLKENAPTEGPLCIADEGRTQESVNTIIHDLRNGVPDVDIVAVDAFIDTVFFGPSKRSIGIQMADYANFFLKMHCMGDERAEPFFQIIESLYTEKPIIAHFAGTAHLTKRSS
jgi:hypothetical protein